jgi:PIN domain nuclease of toxin-antitoxin system
MEWFEKALGGSNIQLLAVTSSVSSKAVDLPEHHSDPQDRIIIATTLVNDGMLVSADKKFPLYEELSGRLIGGVS